MATVTDYLVVCQINRKLSIKYMCHAYSEMLVASVSLRRRRADENELNATQAPRTSKPTRCVCQINIMF